MDKPLKSSTDKQPDSATGTKKPVKKLVKDIFNIGGKPRERAQTIRWLLANQTSSGGFSGRLNKDPDACYCFWCGGALKVRGDLVLKGLQES